MTASPLILIADDSLIQRKIYSKLLTTNGYEVMLAENGLQAVEMALEFLPVLILMDISMPEMDGLTATHELRHHPEMSNTPIIAITAATDPADIDEAYNAGCTEVVDKKSDLNDLLDLISQLLN